MLRRRRMTSALSARLLYPRKAVEVVALPKSSAQGHGTKALRAGLAEWLLAMGAARGLGGNGWEVPSLEDRGVVQPPPQDQEHPDEREAYQPAAAAHDRGHGCPQVQREDARQLPPPG